MYCIEYFQFPNKLQGINKTGHNYHAKRWGRYGCNHFGSRTSVFRCNGPIGSCIESKENDDAQGYSSDCPKVSLSIQSERWTTRQRLQTLKKADEQRIAGTFPSWLYFSRPINFSSGFEFQINSLPSLLFFFVILY